MEPYNISSDAMDATGMSMLQTQISHQLRHDDNKDFFLPDLEPSSPWKLHPKHNVPTEDRNNVDLKNTDSFKLPGTIEASERLQIGMAAISKQVLYIIDTRNSKFWVKMLSSCKI